MIPATHEGIGTWVEFKVFPGHDGRVRVVHVRIAGTDYVRPVTKLCLMEIQRGRKELNTVLFKGEDVTSNPRSLTLTPSVWEGRTKHCMLEFKSILINIRIDCASTLVVFQQSQNSD